MKIFVSGQIEEKVTIRGIFRELEARGHTISHDWTQTDNISDKLSEKEECGARAKKDIDAVIDCDIYILMSNNRSAGKGMYVELGAALALRSVNNKPDIYIVGPMNHLSIFYLHPDVKSVQSIEGLLSLL